MGLIRRASIVSGIIAGVLGAAACSRTEPNERTTAQVRQASVSARTLVGYWHNFDNKISTPAFRLNQVPAAWDVIVIAFAEDAGNGNIRFDLDTSSGLTVADFKSDILAKQAAGKKVVLSLGGEKGTVTLNTAAHETNFVNSLNAIIADYKFDGLDIDLESGAGVAHGTQIQSRMVTAIQSIAATYEAANPGKDFYLSMAPEHPYVHGALVAYSGIWGSYLPMIGMSSGQGLRDELDLIHVQLYNNGGLQTPYSASAYPAGSVDMMVAAQLMLIQGFTTASGATFSGLAASKVAIGMPSGTQAANSGYAPPAMIIRAMDCLTMGTGCDTVKPGTSYWPSGTLYPNFRGIMTWSINWDEKDGHSFSNPIGAYLSNGGTPDTTAPSAPSNLSSTGTAANSVALSWTAATDNVGVASYQIFRGGTAIGNSTTTTFTDNSVAPSTSYSYTVKASDAAGNISSASNTLNVTTPASSDTTAPSVPGGVTVGTVTASSVALSWSASSDAVGVTGYKIYRGGTQIATVTKPDASTPPATSYTDSTVSPSTSYKYSVSAYDAAGNTSNPSSNVTATTPSVSSSSCSGVASFVAGSSYSANAEVLNMGCRAQNELNAGACPSTDFAANRRYKCKVPGWCSTNNPADQAFAPGTGRAWTSAWDYVADCTASADTTDPTVPTNLAFSNIQTTSVTVSWTASTDAGGIKEYRIFRGGAQIATTTSTSYTNTGLSPSTTYSYSVQAVDNAGNTSGQTAAQNVTTAAPSDSIKPTVPSNLAKGTVTSNSVVITWTASTDSGGSGLAGYDVFRDDMKIASPTSASFTDNTVAANTTYTYTVRARDNAGNLSAMSSGLIVLTASANANACLGLITWTGGQPSTCYYPTLGYVQYNGKKYRAVDAACMHAYCIPDGSGQYGACGWELVSSCN